MNIESWLEANFGESASIQFSIVALVVYVLYVVAAWKIFTKAGRPGILSIIPIVNIVVIVRIAGYSGWLVLLYLIPIVNVIFNFLLSIRLGERFSKGVFFSIVWLWLLPFVGYFVLGYGRATYREIPR